LPAVGETRDLRNVMVAPAARAVKKEARVTSKLPAFVAPATGASFGSSSSSTDRVAVAPPGVAAVERREPVSGHSGRRSARPARRATEQGGCRRAFFFILPNLADDSALDVYAFRLLAHYQRVAGPSGACAEPTAAAAARCHMSLRRLAQARTALVAAGWISLSYQGSAGRQVPVARVVDRMAENIARYHHAPTPAEDTARPPAPTDTPAPSAAPPRTSCPPPPQQVQGVVLTGRALERTPENQKNPPVPPQGAPERQPQGERKDQTETAQSAPPPSGPVVDDQARVLAGALYRGLGADLEQLTPALRRRELAIARQLVAVGATAREAEAYAREAGSQAGRFAAVDLRSYERERLGWQARRQGAQAALARRIDRTGEPPAGVSGSIQAGALVRGLFGGQP